jgi:hypothetical protein
MTNFIYSKKYFANIIASLFLLCSVFNATVNAQTAPDFGTVSNFVLFSGIGAVSNTGISTLTGNVGANIGAISGFEAPTTINGTIENVNAITLQAALDLTAACVQLQNTAATVTDHLTIYGNGETLLPGVYSAGAASSINGSLILDAQGDPNALFIFKIGGALTATAGATIILANGALAANVIWIANGAASMAAGTTMNGTVIGYDGAVSMGAGCILNGRLLSNIGAVSIYGTIATNIPESSPTDVSSGNNGGLESNGDLATLIAKRNFNRIKTNSSADKKTSQKKFVSSSISAKKSGLTVDFSTIIPTTGMYGTETAYVSSPTDLIGVTNAIQVYSVDYYQGENRLAAVFATATDGTIYDHSKAICDRLNNSSLEDIRTINLNGYEIIMSKLKRDNGDIEYALNFSVQNLETENKLHSYWNIDQYPTGDYLNFQVWGSSIGQICSITNAIIAKFQQQGTLLSGLVNNRIPTVFVKHGLYQNGILYLTIINKSEASNLVFIGNKRITEVATTDYVSQNIAMSGGYEQNIELDLGGIFDIGFSIIGDTSNQLDALYLADGPWGLDYLNTETTVSKFDIDNVPNTDVTSDEYGIERNITVKGEIYGTINLFRNILPGELLFDASSYSMMGFAIQNSLPIEVVLVTENTTDWNSRLRFQIPANATTAEKNVLFENFSNTLGQKYNNEKIKGVVFSVQGNYQVFQPFIIAVSKLTFNNSKNFNDPINDNILAKNIYNYPNPCLQSTTIVLPKFTESANVQIVDMTGRIISSKNFASIPHNNEITIELDNLSKGVYSFIVTTQENEQFRNKFIKN